MANSWYYLKNDRQLGPVAREQLIQMVATGELARDDLVWTDGMADWVPAAQVPGLIAAAPAARPAAPRPAQAAPVAPAPEEDFEEEEYEGLSNGAKIGIIAGCAGGIMLILLIVLLINMNRGKAPATAESDKPSTSSSASTGSGGGQPKKKEAPPQEEVREVAFDVSMIKDDQERGWYEFGKKVGERDVNAYVEKFKDKRPSDEEIRKQVKLWLEERRLACFINCRKGQRDRDAFVAYGRREGMKAAIAKHKLPSE